MLLGQSRFLTKSFHSRIAANQVEFRKGEVSADANGAQRGHAIECFESALLVAETGKDQSLRERACGPGHQFLRLVAAACASQGVAQKAAGICRVGMCGKELDRF